MDLEGAGDNNKKRVSSDEVPEVEDDNSQQTQPKRSCLSLPPGFEAGSVTEAERFFAELVWPQIQPLFRQLVHEEVKSTMQSHFHSLVQSVSQKNKTEEEVTTGSGTSKIVLCFFNQIAPIIFTNNEIKAENGEPLQIAICDATNSNAIIYTGPLSSAPIEFVILDGECGQHQEETLSDFKKSVLTPRDGRRPLIVGNDLKLCLKNGVGFIKSLIITDNSSWIKSKKFRLGAIIRDEKILAIFPRIGEAVSEPFRAMDHRGEVNRKHHPPSREDEVWRLEGIGKEGAYHKNLSSQGIKTVGDFLKAYEEMGPPSLKKLLGNKVPKKTWKMMVDNAHECVPVPVPVLVPTYLDQSFEQNLVGNRAIMGGEANFNRNFEIDEQKNLGDGNELPGVHLDEDWVSVLNFEDRLPPPLFSLEETSSSYEVGNAGTTPNTIKNIGPS